MKYFKQEKSYTCGVACFRMVMSAQGLPDIDEMTLEKIMGTTYKSGTHYNLMIKAAEKFDLDCISSENGTIELVDMLTQQGWTVILAHGVDLPHYAVYLDKHDGQIFLNDPIFGEKHSIQQSKFERAYWQIDVSKYKVVIAEMDLKLDKGSDSKQWYIAYKKK